MEIFGRSGQNQVPGFLRYLVCLLADECDFPLLLNIGSSLEHNFPANKDFAGSVSLLSPQNVSQQVTHTRQTHVQ